MDLVIERREALHFLGWRGAPVEDALIRQIDEMIALVQREIAPRVCMRRFSLEDDVHLGHTSFCPQGQDVRAMLESCHEAVLLAATLGAESERLLLRMQARDASLALLMDAVLSAAIEAVCDREEAMLRAALSDEGLYLTDRFSPGYGDMPLSQSEEILAVLQADRAIGLSVSRSGIMIPRKSVSAIMGVSKAPKKRRPGGCAVCPARERCAMRRNTDEMKKDEIQAK